MVEYQAYVEETAEEEEGEVDENPTESLEEVVEGPDEGELFVIRRALTGLISQRGLEQREAIFHTRCTVGGKYVPLSLMGEVVRTWCLRP